MMSQNWMWVGACATGSSHVRTGTACQDRAGCLQLADGKALIAVVSDGAGSAEFSAVGSRIVVNGFTRCALNHFKAGLSLPQISQDIIFNWLDDIRERINFAAEERAACPRDLAATLVGAIVSAEYAVIAHIGDGACVMRRAASQEWEVPSWPAHGEYASTTYFITDDPQPNLNLVAVEGVFSELAIFSDGLERIALDFNNSTAYSPFFDSKFIHLEGLPAGRNRGLSVGLRKYLESGPILERTDDDKSLILARRVSCP
jgi:Protein phosphatase 2C